VARRKTKDPEFSLFPFMSVLVAVMGTLILIIAGTTQIGLASPKQRVEVDSFDATKKNPIYVECQRDGVLIHPDDPTTGMPVFVARRDLEEPDSPWYSLKMRLQYDPTRYLQMLVRADGVRTFNDVRAAVSDTGIDVGYEPLFGSGDVRFHQKARGR
jgi:biopolymer transport protein ExbD